MKLSETTKKIVAYDGRREEFESTPDEMYRFIIGDQRPDFDNPDVIAIRFVISDNEELLGAEKSSWFINPEFMSDLCPDGRYDNDPNFMLEGFGPKMDHTFPPEILFLFKQYDDVAVLDKFISYAGTTDIEEMSSEEIFTDFAEWLKVNAYNDQV